MKLQLERGSIATPYEPYIESTAYVVAKDEEGNIAELRSLPNGIKDEISVIEGEKTQRVKLTTLQASDIAQINSYTNVDAAVSKPFDDGLLGGAFDLEGISQCDPVTFRDIVNIGKAFRFINSIRIYYVVAKGTTLEQARSALAGKMLTYQLAEPIVTPIQVSGNLISYPSGTVYIEPYVADAGIYTDKIEVLHEDLPIKAIEKVSKVDFDTGLETKLDATAAVIAEDKLSFTHPDLTSGDIVFFTYEYDRESTEGETEIEYYDSRYVIIDSVTGKIYKWQITVANGVPSIELTEV
jgi:hypothetical protein